VATVLLAEDSPQFRDALAVYLRSRGYDVCCAADGEEALRLLREKPVDLVVLDLLMPKFDGVDVLAVIRSDANLRDLPVVMATAASSGSCGRWCRRGS
jgi:CheY-like chemotaxis protein